MPENKPYTRQEKLDLLNAYEDALANPDYTEVWLKAAGITAEQLADWRAEYEAGRLTGDDTELPASFAQDGSIAALAQLYRAHITQVKPGVHKVPEGSAAGFVIYDPNGNWRLDYLARARSALKAVITVATAAPEKFLRPNSITPASAVAQVRAAWGIDRFPVIDASTRLSANQKEEETLVAEKAREAAAARITRWTDQLAGKPLAYEALWDWYLRQEQPEVPLPAHPLSTPPTWKHVDAETWPPDGEGRWLQDMALHLLGPQAGPKDDRQRIIVLRRTVETISDYIRDNTDLASVKIYYQHHVVRPWQRYSMEDLRTPEERARTVVRSTGDAPIVAAVTAMCLHTVLRDWEPEAAKATYERSFDLVMDLRPISNERKLREQAARHRFGLVRLPQLQKVETSNHPEFITNVSPRVRDVFLASEQLRLAPGQGMAAKYITARRAIQEHDLTHGNGPRVIKLADYTANLAVAPRAVRKKLARGQLEQLRRFLLISTEGDPLQASARRNDALALQNRSYDGALTMGWSGLDVLRKQRSDGAKVERDQLIVEEQLCMNLAGSAVQWLEYLLGSDAEWQKTIERRQWMILTSLALHEANRAVQIIEELHSDGHLATQRYADRGFLADDNFIYRAWDILYRCTCAAATVAAAFPFQNNSKNIALEQELRQALDEAHRAITTVDKPILVSELPRLLHSMLWHTFLAGGVLPALKPDTMNGSLVDKDPLTRVLTPEELADPNCKTVMTYTRIALITDWLIQRGWTAGAMGLIQKNSRVWNVLNDRSGGLYGVWREQFDGLLILTRDEDVPRAPRESHTSFIEYIGYPGSRKTSDPREARDGEHPTRSSGTDETGPR